LVNDGSLKLHQLTLLCSGEVLPVHIEVTSASQGGRELEEGIVSTLMKVVSMISIQDLPDGLSDDQRSRAAVLLQELQTMIVGARLVHSILLLCYMPTLELLDSVNATFMSGELTAILQQLFRCLTGVDDLTIAVSITAEDLQQCREALSHAGELLCQMKHQNKCCLWLFIGSYLRAMEHQLPYGTTER